MEKVNADGLTEEEFLAKYQPGNYKRPSVTVDMMVLRMMQRLEGMEILLIQRKNHPYIDTWALPGGFVDIDESAYHAAARELQEETGLQDVYLEQLYTMSQPDRDPRMRVIDIAYIALLPYDKAVEAKAGDDAKDALWFQITYENHKIKLQNKEQNISIEYALIEKEFPNGVLKIKNYIPEQISEEALAFDHAQIILEGLMRLRNKVSYTDVAFKSCTERIYAAGSAESIRSHPWGRIIQNKFSQQSEKQSGFAWKKWKTIVWKPEGCFISVL